MRVSLSLVTITLLTASVLPFSVPAQNAPAPGRGPSMPAPGPYEARLDSLLASQNYRGLAQAVLRDAKEADTFDRALDWVRVKSLTGGGAYIALLYSAALWRLGHFVGQEAQAGVYQNASLHFLVAQWLVRTEGFQCADGAVARAKLGYIKGELRDVAGHLAAMPAADRQHTSDVALVTVTQLFRLRENDAWLCLPLREAGRTTVSPNGSATLPEFVPYQSWKAKRHAAIDEISDEIGGKRLTDYDDASYRMR